MPRSDKVNRWKIIQTEIATEILPRPKDCQHDELTALQYAGISSLGASCLIPSPRDWVLYLTRTASKSQAHGVCKSHSTTFWYRRIISILAPPRFHRSIFIPARGLHRLAIRSLSLTNEGTYSPPALCATLPDDSCLYFTLMMNQPMGWSRS